MTAPHSIPGFVLVTAAHRRLVVTLVCLLLSGCTSFQSAVNGLAHWQENRCDCATTGAPCGNNNCEQPCVTLDNPHGYLATGPVFGGEAIVGPPAPNALDRVLQLEAELEQLRTEKQDLESQLSLAEETIKTQGVAIDTASQELQHALADYNKLRQQLSQWYADLRALEETARTETLDRNQSLHEFEIELEEILAECSLQALSQSVSLPPAAQAQPNESHAPDQTSGHGEPGAQGENGGQEGQGAHEAAGANAQPGSEGSTPVEHESPVTLVPVPGVRVAELPPVIHLRANVVRESALVTPGSSETPGSSVSLVPPKNWPRP